MRTDTGGRPVYYDHLNKVVRLDKPVSQEPADSELAVQEFQRRCACVGGVLILTIWVCGRSLSIDQSIHQMYLNFFCCSIRSTRNLFLRQVSHQPTPSTTHTTQSISSLPLRARRNSTGGVCTAPAVQSDQEEKGYSLNNDGMFNPLSPLAISE